MANDLIIQIPEASALQVFVAPNGIDPYIEKIRQEALAHVPDLSTKQGRAAIASIAAKAKKAADDKRIADESHRRGIIKQAIESFIDCGYDEGAAEDIIGAIVEGRIKNVTINF